MQTIAFFLVAALAEISGCYAFWLWLKLGKSPLWIIPGILVLIIFAVALTKVNASNAGRAFAAYGGIYILLHKTDSNRIKTIQSDVYFLLQPVSSAKYCPQALIRDKPSLESFYCTRDYTIISIS